MKFFAAVVLVVFSLQLAYSQTSWKLNKRIDNYDCEPPCKTKVSVVTMGPCSDAQGCKMPECCGIMSGTLTNFSLTYTASFPMDNGTAHGNLVGVEVGSSKKKVYVPIGVTQVPNDAVAYDYDVCHYTPCPQVIGRVYRFDGMFTIPTKAVTTGIIRCNFVVQLRSGAPGEPVVLCRKIFARIDNSNLAGSANVVKNPLLGLNARRA